MDDPLPLRLAKAVHARPRAVALACLAGAALCAVAVAFLPLNTGLLDVLPSGNREVDRFSEFLDRFGMLEGLVVVVESPEADPALLAEIADAVGARLSASPLIDSVDGNILRSAADRFDRFPLDLDREGIRRLSRRLSPPGIRAQIRRNRDALLSPLSGPLEAELIARDPLNLREIIAGHALRPLGPPGLDVSTGYYLDSSHTLALVFARPGGDVKDIAFVRKLSAAVEGILAAARRDTGAPAAIRFGITGGYARAAEVSGAVWDDMVRSFGLSFLLVMAIVHWAFRPHPVILGMISLTLAASLLGTLLVAFLAYGSLNIVTSIVATMLVGLYVDYQIIVLSRFRDALRGEADPGRALENMMEGSGKAIVSSSLTTAASFFSVVVTSFRGLHELGVVAGTGMLLCLAANLVFFPALLCWVARSRPSWVLAGRPVLPGAGRIDGLVDRRGTAILVAAPVILLLVLVGLPRLRFVSDLEALGLRRSPAREAGQAVERKIGKRGEPLFLAVRGDTEAELDAAFDALERKGRAWLREGRIRSFLSPGLFLPPPSVQEAALRALAEEGLPGRVTAETLALRLRREMEREGMNPDPSVEAYARRLAGAVNLRQPVRLSDLAANGEPRLRSVFHRESRTLGAYLFPPGDRFDGDAVDRLREDVLRLGASFSLTGPAILYEEIRSSILRESGMAVLLSFAANLLILRLHFRRWGKVLLAMLPVTAGVLLTVGAMGILGLGFNFFNIAAIALIVGFGVDYGIYVMQAASGDRGGDPDLRGTGGVVLLCALTTIASCGSLFTLSYRGLASIGAVLTIGSLSCVLSSLLLLPAVLRRTARRAEGP